MLEIVQDEYKWLFKYKLRQIHKKKVGLFSGTSFLNPVSLAVIGKFEHLLLELGKKHEWVPNNRCFRALLIVHLVGPLQGSAEGCNSCFHWHGCSLEIYSIVGKDQGLKPESTIFEELLYLSWCRTEVSVLPDRRLSWSVSCVAVVDGAGYGHSKGREFLCEYSSN